MVVFFPRKNTYDIMKYNAVFLLRKINVLNTYVIQETPSINMINYPIYIVVAFFEKNIKCFGYILIMSICFGY